MTPQRKEKLMTTTMLHPLEKKILSHHSKQESNNQHNHKKLTNYSPNHTPWEAKAEGLMLGMEGDEEGVAQEGPILSPKYSTIHANELKSIANLDTHEDITLDSDSEESVNWKEHMSVMMKDLRGSIMIDVKDMMDKNMKEFMREIATSVRNDIKETLKDAMITKKKRREN